MTQETEDNIIFRGTTLLYDCSYTLKIRMVKMHHICQCSILTANRHLPYIVYLSRITTGAPSAPTLHMLLFVFWQVSILKYGFRTAAPGRVPDILSDASHQPASLCKIKIKVLFPIDAFIKFHFYVLYHQNQDLSTHFLPRTTAFCLLPERNKQERLSYRISL